jgi:hypothetical protein
VRSLLAQLDEGVAEQAAQRYTFTDASDLGPKMLRSNFATGEQYEESKSLQDLVFCVFEDGAEAEGILVDFPESLCNESAWESGSAQGSLQEGQLLRLSAPILIVDPTFFKARLDRFLRFVDALAAISIVEPLQAMRDELDAQVQSTTNRDARKRAERDRERKLSDAPEALKDIAKMGVLQGASEDSIRGIADFLDAFLGETIAVRVLACGAEHASSSFGGVLLSRDEYLQKEREALFSRYGQPLEGWTAVMQVAKIPPNVPPADNNFDDLSMVNESGQADRSAVESAAARLLNLFESLGLAEGPRWPSITMTPLAIYRVVPEPL